MGVYSATEVRHGGVSSHPGAAGGVCSHLAQEHGGSSREEGEQVARPGWLEQRPQAQQLPPEQQLAIEEAGAHLGDG